MAKLTLDQAKDRFRAARRAVRDSDKLGCRLLQPPRADTLLAIKGQPVGRQATMLVQMAVAMEVLADRKGLPDRIARLP